ncbi:MAG: dihydropteroate synthase [Calditrichaeota bacterium]|nr:MAG: dihydropteroate synthase [Calditrichota bacterium]
MTTASDTKKPPILKLAERTYDLSQRTLIMGVINCTPDSFYSSSRVLDAQKAIETGIRMMEEGADILDVGGESTRPGSEPVNQDEELRRVLPVIEGLLANVSIPISIDTYKATVAARALSAGVHMVNDISALQFDPQMVEVVAQFGVPVVLMHIKGRPKEMQRNPSYENLMGELFEYFAQRIQFATNHGIPRENLILDPGIGFGKRLQDNYEIIRRLREFSIFDLPILVGPSRKSFLGKVLNLPPEELLEGTLAACAVAIQNGAHILRVHDVKEVARAVKIVDALIGKSQVGMHP